jgi:hypothetical protein
LRLLPKGNFTTLNRKVLVTTATSKGRSLFRECLPMLCSELRGKSAFDSSELALFLFDSVESVPFSIFHCRFNSRSFLMFNVRILSIVLVSFISCVTLIADESQSSKSPVALTTFITKSGFDKDDVVSLLRFGTPALKEQYKEADEFDRGDIVKTIKKKQDEIKSQHFFIEIPYFTDELKVESDNASVRLVVPVKYFNWGNIKNVQELAQLGLESKLFEKVSFDITYCHPLVEPQYAGIIDKLMTDVNPNLGSQLAEEGEKAIYMEGNLECPILLISVVSTKETIKNIVRQKDQYRIKIELTGLYFVEQIDMPHVYYYYGALKREKYISPKISFDKEKDDEQPDVWVTRGKEKMFKICADITEVKFIETEK